jgi:hypothetical protein
MKCRRCDGSRDTRLTSCGAFQLPRGFVTYWRFFATPSEKHAWILLVIGLVAFFALLAWWIRKIYYRAVFNDLYRIDPDQHRGGRPERIGRLYGARPFLAEDGTTQYRLRYRHASRRLFPFGFDHIDVPRPPTRTSPWTSLLECGRLERDSRPGDRRRVATHSPHPASPILRDFRDMDAEEDRRRKESIVVPGARMNPEVARRKYASEESVTPEIGLKIRDARRASRARRRDLKQTASATPSTGLEDRAVDAIGPLDGLPSTAEARERVEQATARSGEDHGPGDGSS